MHKHATRARPRLILVGAAAVVIIALGTWFVWPPATADAPKAPPPAVPVQAAPARRADVPIFLTALGNVQAFNTVTIHSRVDGQLQTVAFSEGQDVKAGDLLAQIDPRPFQATLDQATAKKAQDEAQLANARRDLDRYVRLAAQNAISRQTADTQRALVAQLDATVKGDQAAIESASVQLGYTTITAPIDGRTGIRQIDTGNIVHATDTNGLVVLTQLQPISVLFTLPEENLPDVSGEMQQGALQVIAMTGDEKTELDRGTLTLIDNQIDQTTGTMRLKATFPNPNHSLWPGQFVKVKLLLRTQRNALTVPSTAVQRGPQGLFAYVIKPDATVEMRPLKAEQLTATVAVISDGLQDGERVVTAGQYRLQPGTRVDVREQAAGAGS
jgi:membrane fusion protein, multidrug efflux system